MKQQEAMQGYNNMVQRNFEDLKPAMSVPTGGYDPQSIADKMSKFKFAKNAASTQKDQNWFSKLNTKSDNDTSLLSNQKPKKGGLTEEQERQIQKDMIPQFIARQQELQPEYEHIKNVSRELKQLKEEYGVVIKHAPSQATTSFMNRRGS